MLGLLIAISGWTVQGLPLVSYSTDEGFGYGLRLQFVDHGSGSEQPFRYAINGQFFQTTKGIAAHHLAVDAPAFLGSRYRVAAMVSWSIYKFAPYYGLGNTSTYQPSFDTCSDHAALAANPDVCPDNPAFRGLRYYNYDQNTLPVLGLSVRRDLEGPWKLFAGYRFRMTRITPLYSGEDLGQQGGSQMIGDAAAGKLTGYDGSDPARQFVRRTGEITGGVIYDNRDNEPAPAEGMFLETSLRAAAGLTGSEFNFWGVNATLRFYHWIFTRGLVVALRLLGDLAGGDVPFYLLPSTGGLSGPDGLGGGDTVRGLLANRLQGKAKALANAELRWQFLSLTHFDFRAVTGVDCGRVWSAVGASDGGPIHCGAAAGLRAAWNRDFVVRLDYGFGLSEPFADGSVYLTFDEVF